jgi:hypothetical protein
MSLPSPAEQAEKTDGLLGLMSGLRDFAWKILEAGFLLIGLIILVYLLLGTGSGAFVEGVIANLGALVAAVTPQALIGVAIVVAITQILKRR